MKKHLLIILINSILALIDGVLFIAWLITKKEELMYPLGLCTGLLVSILIVSLVSVFLLKKRSCQTQFDERQIKNRGFCFCVSFFVLLITLFLDGIIRYSLEYEWSNYFVGVFTWCMISIGVFANTAIWMDAYTSVGENKLRFSIFLGFVGVLDGSIGMVSVIQNKLVVQGQVTISFINLLGGIVLLITAVNLLIKYRIDKRKEFIEDEEFETEVC